MRLGVGLEFQGDDPEQIARGYYQAGYAAAVCPAVTVDEPDRIRAIIAAFRRWDVVLAEVGVWNNLLDPDLQKREANLQANIQRLAVAEELGAVCCVNISGSYDPDHWDGPHPLNLSRQGFEETVENVRRIIDAVKPQRTHFCIETMPWSLPDSPDSYLELIHAINRPALGVHLDPVNWISSPQRFFANSQFIRECFSRLGPWIMSCHAKDITLDSRLTVHLDEARPGLGSLDYTAFLQEAARLSPDLPVLLEHLPQSEYPAARDYVLAAAERAGVPFKQSAPPREIAA